MKYKKRLTQITITPQKDDHFYGITTKVTIKENEDDGLYDFIEISQGEEEQTIAVDAEEWQAIKEAVDRLFFEISIHSHSPNEPDPDLPQNIIDFIKHQESHG